jgi:hypothetical protein
MDLMQKLHNQVYPGNKENNARKPNFMEKKRFIDYGAESNNNNLSVSSDNNPRNDKDKTKLAAGATILGSSTQNKPQPLQPEEDEDDYENDPWDMDDRASPNKKAKAPAKLDDDLDFGKDIKKGLLTGSAATAMKAAPVISDHKKDEDNGLFVDNDFGDDFDEDEDDEDEEEVEDKPVVPEKKSHDIFERPASSTATPAASKEPEMAKPAEPKPSEPEEEEDQEKLIVDQFQLIYDRDPQLRQVIGADASSLTLEEKYQILTAYMNGGGVQGLLDEGETAEIDPEEEQAIEEEFNAIYESDPKLREVLGGAAALSQLGMKDKYQILVAYKKGGGVQGLLDDGEGPAADESSVIEHQGQKFKRVQIEGENQEYLMDEGGNIYDLEFNYVGQANGSDEEEGA